MTIGRGLTWVYDHMTRGLSEETVDEVDAYLGDRRAAARVAGRRRDAVALAGVDIG